MKEEKSLYELEFGERKKDKLQITPLKFGVNWILHPKVLET